MRKLIQKNLQCIKSEQHIEMRIFIIWKGIKGVQ